MNRVTGQNASLLAFMALFLVFPWFHGLDLIWEQTLFAGCSMVVFAASVLTTAHLTDPRLKVITALLITWLVYASIYIVPMPDGWISAFSPDVARWYSTIPEAKPYLSVYRQASFIELIKFITLSVLFLSVCHLGRNIRTVLIVSHTIVTGCVLTALYSLLNFATNGAYELIGSIAPWDLPWKDGIRGTFSYKNQYAMYLALVMALAVGLLAQNISRTGSRRYSALLIFELIILAATLINTSSRGAIVSLIGGAAITFLLFIYRNRSLFNQLLTLKSVGIALLLVILGGTAFTQSSVYERFANQQLEDNGRALLRQTAMGVIKDHPLTGSGPGTYPYIQHVYKPMELGISKMSKRAHNDYLETLATMGIIGFTLLALPLGLLFVAVFRNRGNETGGLLLGIRAAILAFLIQSSFDTNTGIFFLPVLFTTIISLGFILNFPREESGRA